MPVIEQTGTTGWKLARATARSRSATSVLVDLLAADVRSISDSSSDSSMTASISSPRRPVSSASAPGARPGQAGHLAAGADQHVERDDLAAVLAPNDACAWRSTSS